MTAAGVPEVRGRRTRATLLGGAGQFILRRLRLEPGAPVAMLVLVGVTCFLFAALPRLFNNFADDGLRHEVVHAAPLARNVRELEWGRLTRRGLADPLPAVVDRAARLQQALPRSLRELIERRAFVVRSPRYVLQPAGDAIPDVPGLARYLTIRIQSGVRPHLRFVAGRVPGVSRVRVRAPIAEPVVFGSDAPAPSTTKNVPLVEVALSTTTARLLRLHVGDRAVFTPDLDDVAVQRAPFREQRPLAVEVVGLFAVDDPLSTFWFGDSTLGTPEVEVSQDLDMTWVYAQALVSPDGYERMLGATPALPLAYEYRYFVDAAHLDAGVLGPLSDDLTRLGARYAGAGPLEQRVETGLALVLENYRRARSQAETLLAVAAIGLLACALANVGLLAALWHDRRQREIGLSRTRGASSRHVLAAQAAEGLLLAVPAALAGWTVAVLAIEARSSSVSAWCAVAIVAGTVALLVAAVAGVARRPLGALARQDVVLGRPSPRRLVVEGLVAVAAVLGVLLLRRRGLEADDGGSFDPYLAGVPVLLALGGGIVALRLYRLPIAAAARLARRGRGVALHLGLSRAARQPDLSAAPLLALLLALAIAAFSSGMLSTLEAGQNRAGSRAIGAELRVDAPVDESLPPRLVSRLESIGTVARAYVQDAGFGEGSEPTLMLALDLDAYEHVTSGSPVGVRFPRELRADPPVPGVVPALVSTGWPGGGFFQVELPDARVGFIAVTERVSFPGVPSETPFMVVPLGALEKAGQSLPVTRVYIRGASAAAVRQAVEEEAPRAAIGSRSAVTADLRASPLVASAFRGFRAAILLAALYAGVAVALMAIIADRSRARDLALVRTMGGSSREALVLAAVELIPFVAAALVVGLGLGLLTPYLIAPGLDLDFYTGDPSKAIAIDWLVVTALAAGLVVLVGVTGLLVGLRTRRARLDRVLRVGER